MSAASWTRNGFRYWQLKTADAEIVASVIATYTPHTPPLHAKYEVYSVKKGMARFLGYASGAHAERLHLCFQQAFATYGGF